MRTTELANAARRLKENPDFIAIFEEIERDIFTAFRGVRIGDADALTTVHHLSHGFALLNKKIDKYIEIANFEASKSEQNI